MGRFADGATEVALRLQDTATVNRTRAKNWLNLSKDEIQARSRTWDFLQQTNSLVTSADTPNYALSLLVPGGEDWNITRVEYLWMPTKVSPVPEISNRAFDALYALSATRAEPQCWTTWGEDLLVGPTPNDAYTYTVRFYRDIPDFVEAGEETPPWPKTWDNVWYAYAEYLGLMFNDDERARARLADFEAGMGRMLGADLRRSGANLRFGERDQQPTRFRDRNDYLIVP